MFEKFVRQAIEDNDKILSAKDKTHLSSVRILLVFIKSKVNLHHCFRDRAKMSKNDVL